MEARSRKQFEGISNVIRFNRHFYIAAAVVFLLLLILFRQTSGYTAVAALVMLISLAAGTFLSLAVSFYVYDVSPLYTLSWLSCLSVEEQSRLVNIHAGFDETSHLLAEKYPLSHLSVLDFYDAALHTEVSIARARKRYASYPGTVATGTSHIPLTGESADYIFAILSAHEIRNRQERILFFKELNRVLKAGGTVVVAEHLRDIMNFVAYNIGFFHFLPEKEWKETFMPAGLQVTKAIGVTPFVKVFFLQKHVYPL